MADQTPTDELRNEGWTRVELQVDAYTDDWFDDRAIDRASVMKFLDAVDIDYRLVEFSDEHEWDYALQETRSIDGRE